ncbi:F-box only protein 36 [Suncus etruscus]|uniref:F-box only protein 36 n=1 Tax=Suncus etruscus TaxID=109475 RepID=UPI002110603A|nr:F-box only protein 36 [Suncus etruscus]
MASWLPETLYEALEQGSAPSKDYYQLQVTRSQVIFRWWKISLRSEYRSTKPGEVKENHKDFLENSHLQVQILLAFGSRILGYIHNLCEGKIDFLERLSDALLLKIFSYLDLEDIARLSQTSQRFSKLCKCDMLWEKIIQGACDNITSDMRTQATEIGWREMFFANRLELQQQLLRRKQRQERKDPLLVPALSLGGIISYVSIASRPPFPVSPMLALM